MPLVQRFQSLKRVFRDVETTCSLFRNFLGSGSLVPRQTAAIKPSGDTQNKTHMTTRAIPYKLPSLRQLGTESLAGANALGATLSLAQNTAARISIDHYDVFGEPGETPTNRGKEAALNAKRDALTAAQGVRREAMGDGREFCAKAVDLFKAHLGRKWNSAWMAAGFTRSSIAVSKADVPTLLMEIRNYLRENVPRENAALGITAAAADTKLTAVDAATIAVSAAAAARKLAAQAFAEAKQKLRDRLGGLREELDRILSEDDSRWLQFGFSRPVDSRMPSPVTGLTATPGLPGQVQVQHAASARAANYRVSWKPQSESGETTEVGLFADLAMTLSGLPSGLTIVVSVTARNDAGETQPAEVTIVVP